jgi:hypothetical protein
MWIDGRRAFRPDSGYYRTVRRKSLRSSRRRNASILGVAIIVIVAIAMISWMIFG